MNLDELYSRLVILHEMKISSGEYRIFSEEGINFRYTLLKKSEIPAEIKENNSSLAFAFFINKQEDLEDIVEKGITDNWIARAEKAIEKGTYYIFVCESYYLSLDYAKLAALHEYTELTNAFNHGLATKVEFEIAQRKGDKFLRDYTL